MELPRRNGERWGRRSSFPYRSLDDQQLQTPVKQFPKPWLSSFNAYSWHGFAVWINCNQRHGCYDNKCYMTLLFPASPKNWLNAVPLRRKASKQKSKQSYAPLNSLWRMHGWSRYISSRDSLRLFFLFQEEKLKIYKMTQYNVTSVMLFLQYTNAGGHVAFPDNHIWLWAERSGLPVSIWCLK